MNRGVERVQAERPARRAKDVHEWLRQRPSLTELRQAYPLEWEAVQREVAALVARDDVDELKAYLARAARPPVSTPGRSQPKKALVSAVIRQYMTVEAVNQAYLAASTGISAGTIRFNLVNGYLMQKLLFAGKLERKPVSMFWFRLIWPMLSQRRLLMPLVRPQGIYCFYSAKLIARLAAMIGDRSCLEIGAGDGTLSEFLCAAGTQITATDDHSWGEFVTYPGSVLRQSAEKALNAHQPQVVICSWPPAGNSFEQHVFATASVQTYIVVGSQHESAAGNWATYRQQSGFDLVADVNLSRAVLPPENAGAVHVFQRKSP